jgi:hypothetical protein
MIPEMVAIVAARNVPFFEEFAFAESGVALDLTGCTAALQVRLYGNAGGSALIDLANVTADATQGVWIRDPAGGVVKVWIGEAALNGLPAPQLPDQAGEPWSGVYDLVITWPDGVQETLMEGIITVKPGVTR